MNFMQRKQCWSMGPRPQRCHPTSRSERVPLSEPGCYSSGIQPQISHSPSFFFTVSTPIHALAKLKSWTIPWTSSSVLSHCHWVLFEIMPFSFQCSCEMHCSKDCSYKEVKSYISPIIKLLPSQNTLHFLFSRMSGSMKDMGHALSIKREI